MTREEIMALKPGLELDTLVADVMLGMEKLPLDAGPSGMVVWRWYNREKQYVEGAPPQFSREMASAWLVVEEMAARGYHWRLSTPDRGAEEMWAGLTPNGAAVPSGRPDLSVGSKTMPHAICLVALVVKLAPSGDHELRA